MRIASRALGAALAVAVTSASCSSTSKRISSPASSSGTPTSTAATAPSAAPSGAGASWTTYFHDAGRSGVAADGPAEAASVHQHWASAALDGKIYAEPLLVGSRVIVATENDSVYALNATSGAVLWSAHLGTPVSASSLPCGNVDPVGITSTPVVDAGTGRVYAAGMVQPAQHKLFALDLATGAVVASTGVDAPGADPSTHNQRGALALAGGSVLVPFGGRYGDCGTYHGQLVAVPLTANGLGAPSSYTLPSGREGGFWAPPGPAISGDGGIYLASGNTASGRAYDYGNSVLHLNAALRLVDSFAVTNWAELNSSDSDLGSTSPVLVSPTRVFQVGKSGVGYLLDAGHLGGIGGELFAGKVCAGQAMGGVSHDGTTIYVSCDSSVAAVSVTGDRFSVKWTSPTSRPGPAIITQGAVWSVSTESGVLEAVSPATGNRIFSKQIGAVPSRFISPAAGGGLVVVGAGRTVMAFGD